MRQLKVPVLPKGDWIQNEELKRLYSNLNFSLDEWFRKAEMVVNESVVNVNNVINNGAGLPDQTSNSGKYLTTNGTDASWAATPTELPSQTGNSGKYLTTDGSDPSWGTVSLTVATLPYNIGVVKYTGYSANSVIALDSDDMNKWHVVDYDSVGYHFVFTLPQSIPAGKFVGICKNTDISQNVGVRCSDVANDIIHHTNIGVLNTADAATATETGTLNSASLTHILIDTMGVILVSNGDNDWCTFWTSVATIVAGTRFSFDT